MGTQYAWLALACFFWLLAPIASVSVSIVYFRRSQNGSMGERAAVSAHGLTLALLYAGAIGIHISGRSQPSFLPLFLCAFLVPVAFGAFAARRFRGASSIHFLQLVNIIAGLWIAFIGAMAVTGSWI